MSTALAFAPLSKRSMGRYTAVIGDRRYLVEYRHSLGAWTATVSDAGGSHELGRAADMDGAKQLAQKHAGGQE